ncbi:unnamed protein product [Diabrotica balteata]|uniref:Uncharacterized protein n=1 Tax=Diabrotica balteata TaxID=107213 RepID=A0A9N9T669_DIABA|nr:unnamed protein product [Diabrotica balteata]
MSTPELLKPEVLNAVWSRRFPVKLFDDNRDFFCGEGFIDSCTVVLIVVRRIFYPISCAASVVPLG